MAKSDAMPPEKDTSVLHKSLKGIISPSRSADILLF